MWRNCFCFVLVTSSQLDNQSFKICLVWQFTVWKFCLSAALRCKQTLEWAIPEKNQTGRGLRIYFSENCPGIFHSFTLPLELPDKTKLSSPSHIPHSVSQIRQKFQGQKQKPMEIPHYFFLVTLRNSTSFLIKPYKFHVLFL